MHLQITNNSFSFTDDKIGGWRNLGFSLNDRQCENGRVSGNTLCFDQGGIQQTMEFEPRRNSLVVTRILTNRTATPFEITEVSDGILTADAAVGVVGRHEYNLAFLHTDNARTERFPDSRPEYPYLRQVPYQPVELGRGEANAFPGMVLCDLASPNLLVEGDLDQRDSLRCWDIGMYGIGEKQWNDPLRTYRGRQLRTLAGKWTVAPGETATLSTVFYQFLAGVAAWEAYSVPGGYVDELTRRHRFAVRNSPMLKGAVYCTWNFGTFGNIDEKLLAERARAVAERIPECTHFLIDDGYQRGATRYLDTFYPDPVRGFNPERFPSGMKAMAETIRATGLVPCIWLAPSIRLDSELARQHPEWLLRDAHSNAELLGDTTFLDVSNPEAMRFLGEIFDALFVQWGYRGIKFDFMTQWFTLERARYQNGGSGPSWRERVFAEIRQRIGDDGLFMTCIAMSMGNPFPGLEADCYRCGCDIHDCTWAEQIKGCRATLPQILLEGRQTFLLNMDSAGFGDVPENEQLFRLTWVFITQGILELGGRIEQMPKEQTDLLRRLCTNADRGHRVQCLDRRAITGDGLPQILKVEYPEDSRMARQGVKAHIAFFNWQEHGQPIGADASRLGLAPGSSIADFWTGKSKTVAAEGLCDFLPARTARLYEVRSET